MIADHESLDQTNQDCARRHIRFGWWALLCFLTLGIVLEMLHAFKIGWYLNVANETRRLMWTLAHAHGTLLAVVNLVFGASLTIIPLRGRRRLVTASRSLLAANVLLPAGFFIGGIFSVAGDPGLGILLVPIGALCLLVGVLLVASGLQSEPDPNESKTLKAKRRPDATKRNK